MIEIVIVALVVAVAFVVSGRYLFREVSGGKKGCGAGCGEECPLASACACEPDAAQSDHAPEGCPLTTGESR